MTDHKTGTQLMERVTDQKLVAALSEARQSFVELDYYAQRSSISAVLSGLFCDMTPYEIDQEWDYTHERSYEPRWQSISAQYARTRACFYAFEKFFESLELSGTRLYIRLHEVAVTTSLCEGCSFCDFSAIHHSTSYVPVDWYQVNSFDGVRHLTHLHGLNCTRPEDYSRDVRRHFGVYDFIVLPA